MTCGAPPFLLVQRGPFVLVVDADRIASGGGAVGEGEDIEVLEMPLTEALALVDAGTIRDGKTIMLLQYVALKGLLS